MTTDAELAFRTGSLFDATVTSAFWDSFKGELGRAQVEVLVYLHDHGQARASEIADELNISKQHVSKIVNGFVDSGYIEALTGSDDRRSKVLSLSREGAEYLEGHIRLSDLAFERLVSSMDEAERARLRESMSVMGELLAKYA